MGKFNKEMICTECGYIGKPKKWMKGSFFIELILWLAFLVPGIIYTIWRVTNTVAICPKCEKETLIPTDTPRGAELKAKSTQLTTPNNNQQLS
ncbi:hypothetical protein KBG23_03120 [Candidatus Dojkabacteria bacterium]|mgnify:CR=1 FL=1|jgi:hypothetical protein|nr:hypothetical protein [Candidatus Dojkabacteria bacterium]